MQVSHSIENWEADSKDEFEHKFADQDGGAKYFKYIKSMKKRNANLALVDAKSTENIESYQYSENEYNVIGDSIFVWKGDSKFKDVIDDFEFGSPGSRKVKRMYSKNISLPHTKRITIYGGGL